MGNLHPKDGTAQGVAKVRHYESLFSPEQRLYHDPFAYAMFPGSFVQGWMGPSTIDKLYSWMGMTGFSEMITVRTKWIDDNIVNSEECRQWILLGAGYDTRGFRLELPPDGLVLEVDQPQVQQQKRQKLEWLSHHHKNPIEQAAIVDRYDHQVQFVPVDFNNDSLDDKLIAHDKFQSNQPSVVVMEGVTQYIPKESTADTLQKIKTLVASGSTLLITYVDQNVFDDPSRVADNTKACSMILKLSASVGEPWITGWTQEGFAQFLKECGYQVVSDTTCKDYNDKYLAPLGRKLDEKDIINLERLVVAKLL